MKDKDDEPGADEGLKVTRYEFAGGEETRYEHPSYGMIEFSRVTCGGGNKLFGSSLDHHYTSVRLRIHNGMRLHHHHRDRFRADGRVPIVEVEMSAAQFAEAITAMNVGDGVPCTIRRIRMKQIPDPPADAPLEAKNIRDAHSRNVAETAKSLEALSDRAREVLSKKNLTAKDRKDLFDEIDRATRHFASNQKFVTDSFQEASDRIVSAAKVEIDASFAVLVKEAGLKALRSDPSLVAVHVPPALPEVPDPDEEPA